MIIFIFHFQRLLNAGALDILATLVQSYVKPDVHLAADDELLLAEAYKLLFIVTERISRFEEAEVPLDQSQFELFGR